MRGSCSSTWTRTASKERTGRFICGSTLPQEPGHERRIYTLGTPERFTGESIAREYGARYCGDDLDRWEQSVVPQRPKWQRDDLRIMYRYYQECGMSMLLHDLVEQERLLGAEPRRFGDYVEERSGALSCACGAR